MLVQAVADDLPTLLHWGMFVPNIKCLCDDEQTKKWLPLCSDCRVVGCYAQTEMGHGSNVRGEKMPCCSVSPHNTLHSLGHYHRYLIYF